MEIVLIVIHVIVSLTLILLILLHAGRGGGVSEMFGGGMQSSAMGSTVMEKNLDRITVITAMIFTGHHDSARPFRLNPRESGNSGSHGPFQSGMRAAFPGACMLLTAGGALETTALGGPRRTSHERVRRGGQTPGGLPAPDDVSWPPSTDESNVLDVAIREPNSLDPMRIQDPGSVLSLVSSTRD